MGAMQIATLDIEGAARPAVRLRDGFALVDELVNGAPPTVRGLIADWNVQGPRLREAAAAVDHGPADLLAPADVALRAPLIPGKLLCVGANYHDHVAEMDGPAGLVTKPAPFPYSFLKPATAICGSGRAVAMPSYGRQLDWEVELGVVIGDPAAAAGPDPLAAVFGYTIVNDLSLRDFIPFPHALGLDAVVSKGFDGAAPLGPWITLAEDVPDPQRLEIQLRVNGELMQDSTTAEMIFGVTELVAHYGRVLSLEPGDVIATGTPAGVGAARRPPRWLAPGDDIEATVAGLGLLRTTIEASRADDPLPTTTTGALA